MTIRGVPPEQVRVVLDDGSETLTDCRYDGVVDGCHRWVVLTVMPHRVRHVKVPTRPGPTPPRRGRRVVPDRVVDRAVLLASPGWVAAPFPGVCDRCRRPFLAGTAICRDGGVDWRAECCA
jgi:hypothetical protein